jgi:hypothetical protein
MPMLGDRVSTEQSSIAVGGTAPTGRARRHIEYVTVVLPCLNEEQGVGSTVEEAYRGLARAGVQGEVLVVDNGSTDRSVELATAAGARVIREPRRGYGAAHLAGIEQARGDVIVMADADQTYDLDGMHQLLTRLQKGADIVTGSRLQGRVHPGAMPVLHRHLGTPLITFMLRILTGVPLSDSQSGYRAFWRDRVQALGLRAPGMEYASEMLLRAGRAGYVVEEVPSDYRPRVGESKLNTFADGWRHLRMLLIMSPHLSLIYPGAVTVVLGLLLCGVSIVTPTGIPITETLRWIPIFLGPMLLILGGQAILLGMLAAHRSDVAPLSVKRRVAFLGRRTAVNELLRFFALVTLSGLLIDVVLFVLWLADQSGPALIGIAGVAQAAIVLGLMGIAAVLAADFARESIWE